MVLTKRSAKEFEYTMQLMRLTQLMGPSPDNVIHVNTDLTKQAGESVLFIGGNPLSAAGVGDDGTAAAAAESMGKRNMTVTVHENSHCVKSAGPMSLQRVEAYYKVEKFRKEADHDLAVWRAERLENDMISGLAGCYNENASSAVVQTINEVEPSSTRIYRGGQSVGSSAAMGNNGASYGTTAALTGGTQASNLFGRLVVEHVSMLAKEATPRFRPARFDQIPPGQEQSTSFPVQGQLLGNYYILLVATRCMKNLRGDSQWADMVANAAARGNLHPLLTGGNFLWEGVLGVEYDRCPTRTGLVTQSTLAEGFLLNAGRSATTDPAVNGRSVARNILLGAQAGCFAWAWWPQFTEDVEDTNKPVIKNSAIYGFSTTRLNAPGTSTPGAEEARLVVECEYM
jgi:hypothetical protein